MHVNLGAQHIGVHAILLGNVQRGCHAVGRVGEENKIVRHHSRVGEVQLAVSAETHITQPDTVVECTFAAIGRIAVVWRLLDKTE